MKTERESYEVDNSNIKKGRISVEVNENLLIML